jgi:hypothetical protein
MVGNSPIGSVFLVVLVGATSRFQGPPVFNIIINWAAQLAECNNTVSRGFTLQGVESEDGGEWLMDLDNADDMAVIDDTEEGLQ